MDRAVPAAGDFVQCADSQTASRQRPVDLLDTERQCFAPPTGRRQTLDAPAQVFDGGTLHQPALLL